MIVAWQFIAWDMSARLRSRSPSGTNKNAKRQTPNAERASSNPLARFRKSIKGDRKDDNDADNDLLNVG